MGVYVVDRRGADINVPEVATKSERITSCALHKPSLPDGKYPLPSKTFFNMI